MKKNPHFPRVSLRLYNKDKILRIYNTTKMKRIYAKIRGRKWERLYLRVEYGMAKTNKGKLEMFYKDGYYENWHEALQAFKAFLE